MLCTVQRVYLGIYRITSPYENYSSLDFNIPVGRCGDCYDRYLIRVQEMRESISIIKQCLAAIPEGPCKVENYKYFAPPKKYN